LGENVENKEKHLKTTRKV